MTSAEWPSNLGWHISDRLQLYISSIWPIALRDIYAMAAHVLCASEGKRVPRAPGLLSIKRFWPWAKMATDFAPYMILIWFYMILKWFCMGFICFLYCFTWFLEVGPQLSNDPFFCLLTFFRISNARPEILTTTYFLNDQFFWLSTFFRIITAFTDYSYLAGNSKDHRFFWMFRFCWLLTLFRIIDVFPDY